MTPTPAQLRAARALLDMQQRELATQAGIALRTLVVIEQGGGAEASKGKVVDALHRAGVAFGGTPDGSSLSVQLRRPRRAPGAKQS